MALLPVPISSRQRPRYAATNAYSPVPLSAQSVLNTLRTRSRLTNLAVAILLSVLGISLLSNATYMFSDSSSRARDSTLRSVTPYSARVAWRDLATDEQLDSGRPPSVETTIHRDRRMANINHLIMVPGHAVWTGADPEAAAVDDDEWELEGYQHGGSIGTFVRHIEIGAKQLLEDPNSLLVFSGGATRGHMPTPLTEAVSYHRLAVARGLLPAVDTGGNLSPLQRSTTEEYALDSYENLLFSMARFREVTGQWPERVTVIGYGMKRRRFEQLHRAAIKFPAEDFEYIGIDDEGDTTEHYAGELKNGYIPFLFNPSGCRPPLSDKRAKRNPFARYPSYHASTPELTPLLEWCPRPADVGSIAVPESLKGDYDGEVAEAHERDHKLPPEGFRVFGGRVPWEEAAALYYGRERD